jgi:ATP-dependent Clp protease ATP-binding subunit ClpA
MFERFTDRARRAMVLAQEQARMLNHDYIGTEHILLGLLEAEGVAAKALESLGISLDAVRQPCADLGPGVAVAAQALDRLCDGGVDLLGQAAYEGQASDVAVPDAAAAGAGRGG